MDSVGPDLRSLGAVDDCMVEAADCDKALGLVATIKGS